MLFNIRLALLIEHSGILHTVHLVKIILERLTSSRFSSSAEDSSRESIGEKDMFTLADNTARLFWIRVLFSLFLLW